MKKIILAILAVVYIGTSTGAMVNMHYCMGKLADWGLGRNTSKTCGNCGMKKIAEKDNGCCNDKYQFFKNAADQQITVAGLLTTPVDIVVLPVSFFEIPSIDFLPVTEENPKVHAPPRTYGVAVYIRNCVFLI